jgi:3-oxoacyl-[acyl-carrier protein] reductase
MDMGIHGHRAIVCAASKGLGRGIAFALAREGVDLVINARNNEVLQITAAEIRSETGVRVIPVAADVTTDAGRSALLAACPAPDILINNAGGPPPGDFRDATRGDWEDAINANMLTPILLIQATIDGMLKRRFGRIINITTSGVKSPANYPNLGLSIGVRSGLTGSVAGLARQTVSRNVTINSLMPGRFDTDRMRKNLIFDAKVKGRPVDEVTNQALAEIPAGRFGTPEEFGAMCAFLCSEHAGFVTGQNFVLDGGAFPGLL